LRIERFDIVGCGQCGAQARWHDRVQGEDGYSLPCGHKGEPKLLLKTIRIELASAVPSARTTT
jgi:hypothetical protein